MILDCLAEQAKFILKLAVSSITLGTYHMYLTTNMIDENNKNIQLKIDENNRNIQLRFDEINRNTHSRFNELFNKIEMLKNKK